MLYRLMGYCFHTYGLVVVTAAGGLAGAFLFANGAIFAYEMSSGAADRVDSISWWMHCGWTLGAGLFFVVLIRAYRKAMRQYPQRVPGLPAVWKAALVNHRREDDSEIRKRRIHQKSNGPLAVSRKSLLAGGWLGFLVGISLLLILFSYANSPFAADSRIASAIWLVDHQSTNFAWEGDTASINFPLVLSLIGIPVGLGVLLMGTVGAIDALPMKEENEE